MDTGISVVITRGVRGLGEVEERVGEIIGDGQRFYLGGEHKI